MLRREAVPLFGLRVADALSASREGGDDAPEALVTLWEARWKFDGGEELGTDWPTMFDVLRERRPWRGAWHHPGWSPATFAPSVRTRACVRSVGALVV